MHSPEPAAILFLLFGVGGADMFQIEHFGRCAKSENRAVQRLGHPCGSALRESIDTLGNCEDTELDGARLRRLTICVG
jgi:hypothetical protein